MNMKSGSSATERSRITLASGRSATVSMSSIPMLIRAPRDAPAQSRMAASFLSTSTVSTQACKGVDTALERVIETPRRGCAGSASRAPRTALYMTNALRRR